MVPPPAPPRPQVYMGLAVEAELSRIRPETGVRRELELMGFKTPLTHQMKTFCHLRYQPLANQHQPWGKHTCGPLH